MKKKLFTKKLGKIIPESILIYFRNYHCRVDFKYTRGDVYENGYYCINLSKINHETKQVLPKNISALQWLTYFVPKDYGDKMDSLFFVGDYKEIVLKEVNEGCFIEGIPQNEMKFEIEFLDLSNMFIETKLDFTGVHVIKVLKLRESQKERLKDNLKNGLWKFPNVLKVVVV
jgi:hypothetical protein